MLPYLIFYIVLFILAFLYKSDEKFLIIYFIVFSIFYSFAINIGPDWHNYKIYFDHLANVNHIWEIPSLLPDKESRFEWGFHFLSFLMTRGGYNYHFIIAVLNTISFIVYKKVFDYFFKGDSLILFTFFIMFYGNRLFVSTLRQNLSICFFYLCIVQFSRNDKKWFLSLLMSYLFHSTGILALVVIMMQKFVTRKRFLCISTILVATGVVGVQLGYLLPTVIITLFRSFIPTSIQRIINLLIYGQLRERDLLSLLQFVLMTFIVLVDKKSDEKDCSLRIAFFLIIFSYVMKFHFTNIPLLAARLKYNFGIGYLVVVYKAIIHFKEYKTLYLAPVLYSFMLVTYSFHVVKEDYVCYVPYENLLVNSIKKSKIEDCFSMDKFNARLRAIGKASVSM